MIWCSKLKKGLCKIVTKSQVVTKFNVTKSRLHCISNLYVMQRFSMNATIFSKYFKVFFSPWNYKTIAIKSSMLKFEYCQAAQNYPKSQILFHKNDSSRDLYILTLDRALLYAHTTIIIAMLLHFTQYCIQELIQTDSYFYWFLSISFF